MESRNFVRYFMGIALVLAVLLPLLAEMSFYILNVAIIMLIFILFASAWNFLAYSGQASLGHAAFFGIGGYVSTLMARATGFSPFATIFVGGSVAALIGLLLGLTCVRLKEWFLAMVTFGF
ncbi:MAG: branched-chain amino acid ABC transporter permease, partial [Methanomicrobiales archaeon]|nr:branched-chain amino acid ABC transporter permease [Methanomicrobiales archaeon]